MEEGEALPDHLRCNRTDGRQWRCNRRVMEDKKLCEIHYLQGRHRQHKQKVPESLKIQRRDRKLSTGGLASSLRLQGPKIRAKNAEKLVKLAKKPMKNKKKKLRVIGKSEALDEAVKKMKLKRGDLQLELIRMVLKREVEKKKKRVRDFDGEGQEEGEEDEEEEEEFMRDLPNGLMAISSLSPRCKDDNEMNNDRSNNAGPSCDVKIGVGMVTQRRCFRSKNIEPVPVGAMQVLPWKENVVNLRRGKRKRCHWCRKGGIRRLVKCSSCRKEFFCIDCIKERCVFFE